MMKRTRKILAQYGLHSFLLPLFFVLHSYIRYYGLVSPCMAFHLWWVIEGIFLGAFLLLLIITRHANRSWQITTLLGFIALFYGVIKDFFDNTLRVPFLAKYTVLLPLVILLSGWLIIRVCRKTDFRKTNFFLNVLLILFLAADGIMLALGQGAVLMQNNRLVKNKVLNADTLALPAARPDVYFLVFDSYPGTGFLEQYVQYNNRPFDSLLQSRGFHVLAHPKSNYNHTALSIASALNLAYLQGMVPGARPAVGDYNKASLAIEHATVPAVFTHLGYDICNLSIFDLEGHPALWKENFLVLPEKEMLLYNTLPARLTRDVLWHFPRLLYGRITPEKIQRADNDQLRQNFIKRDLNNRIIDSLLKMPAAGTARPRFVYAHFYLPHPPFFYDSMGRSIPLDVNKINTMMEDKAAFISYLTYTNKQIDKMITALLQDPHRRPVILLQSDHGYRDLKKDQAPPATYFMNYSAFYFPDGNYASLYDTMSNVNSFSLVFNKYFNTHIPLLADSSVLMRY